MDSIATQTKLNNFVQHNLNKNIAEKLVNHSNSLVEKYKVLNEEMKCLMEIEKELKHKEILIKNKKFDLNSFEKKMKDKNHMKVDLQNILESYILILKNNEELLNKRVDDLKLKDSQLKQKENILNKILNKNKNGMSPVLNLSRDQEIHSNVASERAINYSNTPRTLIHTELDLNRNKSILSVISNEEFSLDNSKKNTQTNFFLNGGFNNITLSKQNEFSVIHFNNNKFIDEKKIIKNVANLNINNEKDRKTVRSSVKNEKNSDKNVNKYYERKNSPQKNKKIKILEISHVANITLEANEKPAIFVNNVNINSDHASILTAKFESFSSKTERFEKLESIASFGITYGDNQIKKDSSVSSFSPDNKPEAKNTLVNISPNKPIVNHIKKKSKVNDVKDTKVVSPNNRAISVDMTINTNTVKEIINKPHTHMRNSTPTEKVDIINNNDSSANNINKASSRSVNKKISIKKDIESVKSNNLNPMPVKENVSNTTTVMNRNIQIESKRSSNFDSITTKFTKNYVNDLLFSSRVNLNTNKIIISLEQEFSLKGTEFNIMDNPEYLNLVKIFMYTVLQSSSEKVKEEKLYFEKMKIFENEQKEKKYKLFVNKFVHRALDNIEKEVARLRYNRKQEAEFKKEERRHKRKERKERLEVERANRLEIEDEDKPYGFAYKKDNDEQEVVRRVRKTKTLKEKPMQYQIKSKIFVRKRNSDSDLKKYTQEDDASVRTKSKSVVLHESPASPEMIRDFEVAIRKSANRNESPMKNSVSLHVIGSPTAPLIKPTHNFTPNVEFSKEMLQEMKHKPSEANLNNTSINTSDSRGLLCKILIINTLVNVVPENNISSVEITNVQSMLIEDFDEDEDEGKKYYKFNIKFVYFFILFELYFF